MESPAINKRNQILVFCAVAGLILRLVLSSISIGTNDATTWQRFAKSILDIGLYETYAAIPLFNHPPLMGLLAATEMRLHELTGVSFPFLLRLPGIIAEVMSLFLILKIWGLSNKRFEAIAGFGLSLISILVSGYHGNTDCIMAFFCLLAFYLLEEKRTFFWAGFALAAAVNVKIIPLLLFPALICNFGSFSQLIKISLGFALGLFPIFISFLLGGEAFFKNVFTYNSQLDYWGLQALFMLLGEDLPAYQDFFQSIVLTYLNVGRYFLVAALLIAAWYMRGSGFNAYKRAVFSLIIFAVLAPGFGVQYLVLLPPLLFTFSITWGVIIATSCGIFALSSYASFLVSYFPLYSDHNHLSPAIVTIAGLVAWFILVVFLVFQWREFSESNFSLTDLK